jgi:zinc protease
MRRPDLGALRRPRLPPLHETELPGGLRAIAARRAGVPLVELRLVFPLAARQITKPAGPAVLARSVLAGTDRHDRSGIAEALERLGGSLDASADRDRFQLNASVLARGLPQLLELLSEVLCGATYPANEVASDRAHLADEIIMTLSRPEVLADEALRARLYAGHPYATEIPRPQSVLAVGPAGLRRLHLVTFDPSSAYLVLVGDIAPARACALAIETLGPWLADGSPVRQTLPSLPVLRKGALELVERPGSVQSNIRLGGRAPDRSEPDWPATSLANLILGGMFGSRIVQNLREKRGYTYSPHSYVSHDRAGSSYVLAVEVAKEVTAPALVELRYELGRLAALGVSEDELDSARRYAVGTFALRTATQAGLANTLAGLAFATVGPGYLESYPAAVMRASKAEVDTAARSHLGPANLVSVIVGDSAVAPEIAAVEDVVVLEQPVPQS